MTNDSCDFPAAHSMDTTWFAVDRDGHVAMLDSGEPGAVPETIHDQVDQAAVGAIEELPENGEPALDLAASVHPGFRAGVRPQKRKIPIAWPRNGYAEFVVVEPSPEAYEIARKVPEIHVGRAGDYMVLALAPRTDVPRGGPREQAWTKFLGTAYASPWLVTAYWALPGELKAARRGLFAYRAHHARYNIAEPYGRVLVPALPLRLDEMSPRAKAVLGARPRLDVSFAAEPYVQPAEHVPCRLWSSVVYLARDGRTVCPIAGKEAEYAEEAGGLDADDPSFEPAIFLPIDD